MFINFTNHPSIEWSSEQIDAAREYGELIDVPFPSVSPTAPFLEVRELALKYADSIAARKPDCVLCQGEFNLAFNVITDLREKGIKVVAACSERVVEEVRIGDCIEKHSTFRFVQFREY